MMLLVLVLVVVLGQSAEMERLSAGNADFSTRLYTQVSGSSDENVVVSSLGVTLALATLAAGSGGVARSELLRVLGLERAETDGELEKMEAALQQLKEAAAQVQATGLFLGHGVKADATFSSRVKQLYDADVQQVDFTAGASAANAINEYVRGRTGEKVRDAVEGVEPETSALLVSAAFFTGQWARPFNASFTQEERFFVNKYKTVQVPMMFRSDKHFLAYDPALRVGVLKLPCSAGIATLLLLPDEEVDCGHVEDFLTGNVFHQWLAKLKKTKLEVQMPRFTLKRSSTLSGTLRRLGLQESFRNTADGGLRLSEVVQKVTVEVDETGGASGDSSPSSFYTNPLPPRLTFNRPFLFIVYHEATRCLLYLGRVVDPTQN